MATKKDTSSAKLLKKKSDDAAAYQVVAALVLLCCALLALRSLRAYYATVGGFSALYDSTLYIALGGVRPWRLRRWWYVPWVKNRVVRMLMPLPAAVGILARGHGVQYAPGLDGGLPLPLLLLRRTGASVHRPEALPLGVLPVLPLHGDSRRPLLLP